MKIPCFCRNYRQKNTPTYRPYNMIRKNYSKSGVIFYIRDLLNVKQPILKSKFTEKILIFMLYTIFHLFVTPSSEGKKQKKLRCEICISGNPLEIGSRNSQTL